MRRLVLLSGPVAVLGPLTVLGLLFLPGSSPLADRLDQSDPAAHRATPVSDPAALRLLERASQAPVAVSYRGVQFVSAWAARGSTGLVVDVVHRPGHGTVVRSQATATTPAGYTHLPADSTEPSLLGGASTLTLLGSHYVLTTASPTTVAGRAVDVVVASRPGAASAAARFWLDRETGLVLRREVYDESGRTTRASAFIEIAVGASAELSDDETMSDADDEPRAWPHAIDPSALDKMRDRGWKCPDTLPPGLQLVDARRGGGDYDGIVHLSYSDGLSSVSVFEQRGRLEAGHLDGYQAMTVRGRHVYVRDGVPQRLVWASHGTVFSVMADASARTVGDVVVALPRATDGTGPFHRLGRGFDRVASWFNPFG